jgi:acyl-CoA synthetase (AMP-forming)/AMP-acid ligase II/acetyltransferase-like isoleucine patch superfamily enzyme
VKPHNIKPVVAISLPNGPLLAITVLATATYYTAAPVAHGNGVGKDQFKVDVLQSRSNIVLASAEDVSRLGLRDPWLTEAGIAVLLIDLSDSLDLIMRNIDGAFINSSIAGSTSDHPRPNTADDTAILLFTSGTSGTKKLVPLSVHSMVCGVAMVVESWGLSESMRCLNQMPLNHVGGLIRNLFAPVFSGGSVICCAGFDANLFWDCVEDHSPTWYYASPSMHQCILEAGQDRPQSLAKSRIQLICNAAGGLLPSLAIQLRDTFSREKMACTVLPSYGMTECMPISTPPLDYRLEKTGTSGVTVGPEIAILDGHNRTQANNVIGRISVRGAPVFAGYLRADDTIDKSCFTADGWFDTGDMGYLDKDGFLYITGRSKEVINRGGELISPFEVEEAIVSAASRPGSHIYGRISKALAFSVTHDVLQEVVGIAVVTPSGSPRACLRSIQESVKSVLSSVKVPVLLVYMDDGLPTNNNKILRIKLAERLGLAPISDATAPTGRYFEAVCPPPNTALSVPIQCRVLEMNHYCLKVLADDTLPEDQESFVRPDLTGFYPELIVAPSRAQSVSAASAVTAANSQDFITQLATSLHGYNVPFKIRVLDTAFPRRSSGDIDVASLDVMLNAPEATNVTNNLSGTEAVVAKVYALILSIPVSDLSRTSHFFDLGGDSMAAGKMLNALRKEYPLRLPINVLFANPTLSQLARVIDDRMMDQKPAPEKSSITTETEELLPGCMETYSSTNPILLIIQLLPIVLIWPLKRALTWTVFIYMMSATFPWPTTGSLFGRLLNLVISMAVGRAVSRIVCPLIGIAFKWIVIGRHEEGLYPMWGRYHTRWWIVEKVVTICGGGIFELSNWSLVWYYRMLGAKIGKNVIIHKHARLGEWDLITIGDNAVLERCTVRPFAAERNTSMYLGRINIGSKASVGLAAIVAAGTTVPAESCIGPNSSSWEVSDSDESNRDLNSSSVPEPHWALQIFLGFPLRMINAFFAALPWLAALVALVVRAPENHFDDFLRSIIIWFASPTRVAWHYAALAAHACLGPAFGFACVVVTKKIFDLFFGRITPTAARDRSQMTRFRMQLFETLMPSGKFHKLTELFGAHYASTSVFARAMGAKIGKRVYWPGTGPSIQSFDLLEIGDDVVFGSRSHLVTSDGSGSDYVRIKSGAMVADRVVLLPGSELGVKTVMGSGALAKRGKLYADGTTWVGNKNNEAVCLSVEAKQPEVTGHRVEQYYETMNANNDVPHHSHVSSTATTIVRPFLDSERSSMHLIEKSGQCSPSPSHYDDSDGFKSALETPADSRKPSIHSHRLDSFASSIAPNSRQSPQHKYEDDVEESPASIRPESSSPFGRAFYEGKASYRVWGQFTIFCYSSLVAVLSATWWNAGSIAAVQIVGHMYQDKNPLAQPSGFLGKDNILRPANIFIFFWILIVAMMAFQSIVVIAFTIAAKWILMGRRMPGNYDWDKSSYCQRWQLFLKLETFRRRCYGNIGILGLLTGTHYVVMYFRAMGAKIGTDCALFVSGNPSLMFTEPDLLTLGDRVTVDDASLVGHINTRGKFDLNPLSVGSRSVLRTGSRLLSGARMEEDSCLLEHTLVMAGDVVDTTATVQGWPAEEFQSKRMPTMEVRRHWKPSASV